MTTANFKKAMQKWMSQFGIDAHEAAQIANKNYPQHFDKIAKALTKITQEEMGISV